MHSVRYLRYLLNDCIIFIIFLVIWFVIGGIPRYCLVLLFHTTEAIELLPTWLNSYQLTYQGSNFPSRMETSQTLNRELIQMHLPISPPPALCTDDVEGEFLLREPIYEKFLEAKSTLFLILLAIGMGGWISHTISSRQEISNEFS
jgi:hypothetical protein